MQKFEVSMARTRSRGALDRFEQEQGGFFKRVRRVYLARARHEPRRIESDQANGDIHEVQQRIVAVLEARLARWL